MTRHVNTLHPKDDFECSLCNIKFQDKQAVQSHKKSEHSLKCSKCQNTYFTQSNFNRHKVSCCRCSRYKYQFDSLPELTNHTCETPRKKARLDAEFTNRGKAVPIVCSQLSSVHPPTVAEECQPAVQRSPPVSVSQEEPPTVVKECHPAVQCSPPVSVSVEEPPAVVKECQPAVQCSPSVSVSVEEPPTVVEECHPAVQCSPPVSVSVEEPPTVVEECHPAVQCNPPVSVSVEESPAVVKECQPAVQCSPPVSVSVEEPPTVVEECHPAVQCSPPVSVSVEEPPAVVEECQPAVQCSPSVSVSVEEPPTVVEERHPAVQCSPPGTATAKDRTSASVEEVDERQSIPERKKKSLKIKRPQKAKRNWRELEVIENEQLIEGNLELATFMRLYWSSVRTFIRRGTVQNVFNFYFDRDFQDMVENIAVSIMTYRKNRFKINYGFG